MNKKQSSRRQFLKSTAAAAGVAPLLLSARIWGAEADSKPNARINLGFIGMGYQNRGLHQNFLGHSQVQVLAVCDVDKTRRDFCQKKTNDFYAVSRAQEKYQGCDAYDDFMEIVQRKDIDAVVIATPDHWHAICSIKALESGKDVYCEKPLSLTIAEARAMVNATRKHDRVFQVGSMQRSSNEFQTACELVRNHRIGEVKEIYVSIGGSSAWCDLPTQTPPDGLDWDRWLGPAPSRGYNEILSPRGVHEFFPNWRNYREYSGGAMTDWGAHHFDIAQWGLGIDDSGPVEIIPPDGKDIKRLTYKYANGTTMYHGGLPGYDFGVVFVGEKGKVCVDRGRIKTDPEEIGKEPIGEKDIHLYKSRNHYQDWVNCMRSRKKPICDVEIGCRSVTVCHLGNLAVWNKRALKWDPATERFPAGDEANSWLSRPKRAPYNLI